MSQSEEIKITLENDKALLKGCQYVYFSIIMYLCVYGYVYAYILYVCVCMYINFYEMSVLLLFSAGVIAILFLCVCVHVILLSNNN